MYLMSVLSLLVVPASAQMFTTDEKAPVVCPKDHYVDELWCKGRYCDDVGIGCRELPPELPWQTAVGFAPYTSKDQPRAMCPVPSVLVGLKCRGRYCDVVSPMCASLPDEAIPGVVVPVGTISEENGGRLDIVDEVFPIGIECGGKYCDNVTMIGKVIEARGSPDRDERPPPLERLTEDVVPGPLKEILEQPEPLPDPIP